MRKAVKHIWQYQLATTVAGLPVAIFYATRSAATPAVAIQLSISATATHGCRQHTQWPIINNLSWCWHYSLHHFLHQTIKCTTLVKMFAMKCCWLFITLVIAQISFAMPVGIFKTHTDVGDPAVKGDVAFDNNDQSYAFKAGGYNIWFNKDEFHYAYNNVTGNFILTANVKLIGKGKDPHRKIGWMIRGSEDAAAPHVSAVVHGDGLVSLQWRRLRGAYMRDPEDQLSTNRKAVEIVQLERLGKTFIMRVANPGEPLQEIARTEAVELPDQVLAGVFLCSHDANTQENGLAWNVRIEKTVREDFNGYTDGVLPSQLEIMNVFDGKRKIIHQDSGRFEAPNWMPDDQHLLFNQDGLIWRIPVAGGKPVELNTGSARRNNNDHVISFDGKWLGISSHREGKSGNGSTVYVLPITGGEPKLVTENTPSYLHTWSVDGKHVIYTAQRLERSPAYDLYRKPIDGGEEVQLTFNTTTGITDGPEYSPDGKWLYCNSNETGLMQIWRMKPDGSGKEQLTFDNYNSWFPHISPDGKWIVFISFPPTILSTDHPFYKRCVMRLMPVSGGAPRVIAYFYGGQGSINTPSWSPDSKRIAFVTNGGLFLQ